MRTYWNINGNLKAINEWEPNCWIQVTCPTEEDQQELEDKFAIPDYFLSDISDTDERARYEYDDGWMLIILRIPYVKRRNHHGLLLLNQYDDRLRKLSTVTRRGLHRLCGYDFPPLPVVCSMVS